jgi:hypothetical protein
MIHNVLLAELLASRRAAQTHELLGSDAVEAFHDTCSNLSQEYDPEEFDAAYNELLDNLKLIDRLTWLQEAGLVGSLIISVLLQFLTEEKATRTKRVWESLVRVDEDIEAELAEGDV